jgi:hypothetical protein
MRAVKKTRIVAVVAGAMALLGAAVSGSSADNPPAQNIGWLKAPDGDMQVPCAKAYFDGDANGAPGKERIAVALIYCETEAYVIARGEDGRKVKFDGHVPWDKTYGDGRRTYTKNWFDEGEWIGMKVCYELDAPADNAHCSVFASGRA